MIPAVKQIECYGFVGIELPTFRRVTIDPLNILEIAVRINTTRPLGRKKPGTAFGTPLLAAG